METEKEFKKENERVVLSLRISARVKQKLTEEAVARGLDLSAYCENQLLNFDKKCIELTRLHQEFLQLQYNSKDAITAAATLKNEKAELHIQNEILQKQTEIFQHPRLLEMYNQLIGTAHSVEQQEGQLLNIKIESPFDVLTLLIYSFKLQNNLCK